MSEQHGVPLPFAREGRHLDSYARIIGGPVAVQLGSVYRSGGDAISLSQKKQESAFDRSAMDWYDRAFKGANLLREFPFVWQSAVFAHRQLAQEFFGDAEKKVYEILNPITCSPIAPHNLYNDIARPADPKYTHQMLWLTAFSALLLSSQESENDIELKDAFRKIHDTVAVNLCSGKYGETDLGVLSSVHDPDTLSTLDTLFTIDATPTKAQIQPDGHDRRLTHSLNLPIRNMRVGGNEIPYFTSVHNKTPASIITKTIDGALRTHQPLGVLNPQKLVKDYHGILVVAMRDDDYALMRDAYLDTVMNIFPNTQLVADHETSHGLGTKAQFERWNVHVKPHQYLELMFQRPKGYLDTLFHTGKGEDGINGYAHPLHRSRRAQREHLHKDGTKVSVADMLFPERIYGVDPKILVRRNMKKIVEGIRRSMTAQNRGYLGPTEIS